MLVGLFGTAIVASCATRPPEAVKLDELSATIEKLRTQNAAYSRNIDELENRVFILTDQVDSRKVNGERVAEPKLPTVTLHKGDAPAGGIDEPATATAAFPGDLNVEYVGEAARTSTKRPLLRLAGDDNPTFADPPSRATTASRVVVVAGEKTPRSAVKATSDNVAAAEAPRPAGGPLGLYKQSLDQLRAGLHGEAVAGFREFIAKYPDHDYSDNAQYWLGECFYVRKDYVAAVREFRRVVDRFSQGNKVPDALLKVGFSYIAQGSAEAGRQALIELVRSYPHHDTAALAAAKLTELERVGASGASDGTKTEEIK